MIGFLARVLVLAVPWAAAAQVGILQIRVVEGEGALHAPGSRSSKPLAVLVSDETGHPVAGVAVTLHMPDDGPGGSFGGLPTALVITGADGRAAVRNFQVNRTPGRFEIRITAAKGPVRAGALSFQYITEGGAGTASAGVRGRRKWVVVALAAAGAIGGGIAATAGGSRSAAGGNAAAPVTASPVGIGTPVITVGKP